MFFIIPSPDTGSPGARGVECQQDNHGVRWLVLDGCAKGFERSRAVLVHARSGHEKNTAPLRLSHSLLSPRCRRGIAAEHRPQRREALGGLHWHGPLAEGAIDGRDHEVVVPVRLAAGVNLTL